MSNIVPISQDVAISAGSAALSLEQKWWLAQKISGTEFVPKSFRNRPEAAFAAMLYGAERGFSELEALNNIHVIEGRPSLSAEAMRALVLAAGHTIDIIECNDQRATVVGRRAGSDTTSPPFTWTLDRARRARLANKQNWQTHPAQMLLARASAELCRAVFADVVAGLVALEELSDDVEAEEPATTRRAPARRQQPAVAAAAAPAAAVAPARTPPAAPTASLPAAVQAPDALGGIPGSDAPSWARQTTPAKSTAKPAPAETHPHDPSLARRIHAEITAAFPGTDDPTRDRYRHALVAVVTRRRPDGSVTSSNDLDLEEQVELSKVLANIRGGKASVADGPDELVELRVAGGWRYTIRLDPPLVEVTRGEPAAVADDGLPAQPEFDIDPPEEET